MNAAVVSDMDINSTFSMDMMDDYSDGNMTTQKDIRLFIPYVTFMIFISCLGVSGNLLVIGAILTDKNLRVLSNAFIANLAVTDLLVTGINVPFAVVGVLDSEFLYRHPSLCITIGALSVTTCGCSIWTIMAISVDRYIHICHPNWPALLTRRTAPVLMACPWLLGFVLDLPNFLGWGNHGYDIASQRCTYEPTTYAFNLYMYIVGALIPLLIIPYCYFRIYRLVRRTNRRVKGHKHGAAKDQEMRTLKVVFIIWVAFMLMWNPHGIYVLFGPFYAWPDWLVMVSVALAYSNSSLNCIIYGTMHKNFRQGYVTFCKKICFQHKEAQQQTGSQVII